MLRKFLAGAVLAAALVAQPWPATLPPALPVAWLAPLPAFALDYDLNSPSDVTAITVAATATRLFSTTVEAAQPYRGAFINPTDGDIAMGGASVTASTGFLLRDDSILWLDWSRGGNWYGIRTGGSDVNVRVVPVK
jgi:hypothetical protein